MVKYQWKIDVYGDVVEEDLNWRENNMAVTKLCNLFYSTSRY